VTVGVETATTTVTVRVEKGKIKMKARENWLKCLERDRHNAIVSYAKAIQKQTGCTWSEALQVAEKRNTATTTVTVGVESDTLLQPQ